MLVGLTGGMPMNIADKVLTAASKLAKLPAFAGHEPKSVRSADDGWIAREIRYACQQLDYAEHAFETAEHPDMIDAAIYTMRACECRLAYLFGELKRIGETDRNHPVKLP